MRRPFETKVVAHIRCNGGATGATVSTGVATTGRDAVRLPVVSVWPEQFLELLPDEARVLAAVLVAAADELDKEARPRHPR